MRRASKSKKNTDFPVRGSVEQAKEGVSLYPDSLQGRLWKGVDRGNGRHRVLSVPGGWAGEQGNRGGMRGEGSCGRVREGGWD